MCLLLLTIAATALESFTPLQALTGFTFERRGAGGGSRKQILVKMSHDDALIILSCASEGR